LTERSRVYALTQGLLAAALFGVSAPVNKLLLPSLSPLWLASLLYLGAGAGLSLVRALRRGRGAEAPLGRTDVPALLGVVLLGGVAGPVLLLLGLSRVTGVAGSLLLNLEGPLTIGLAVVFLGEHLTRREGLGAALVFCGAAALGLSPEKGTSDFLGMAMVALACACWAVDNNLSQRLSLKDPVAVVRLKGLLAGAINLPLAFAFGQKAPGLRSVGAALVLGAFSYGVSVVLSLRSVRVLGAARGAALFASAPFLGALASVVLLGERLGLREVFPMAAMVAGVALLATARHGHLHTHESLVHEHLHVHDEHHQHPHEGPVSEPHSHEHRHDAITHDHPHASDLHHRHPH